MKDDNTEIAERREFPKMLFAGGEVRDEAGRPTHHSNTRTVHDAEEEAAARAEGFTEAAAGEPEVEEIAAPAPREPKAPAEPKAKPEAKATPAPKKPKVIAPETAPAVPVDKKSRAKAAQPK